MSNPYKLQELSIELSNYCLMECLMCSSGSSPTHLPNELTEEEVLSLLLQADNMGAEVVSFSGGDPLLHPDAVKYVLFANGLGFKRILFYTSGISDVMNHYDNSYAHYGIPLDFLLDVVPAKDKLTIIFSLHSYQPQVHDYIVGISGAWQVTTSSIDLAIKAGYDVNVHMVPMLPNWRDVLGLRKLCAKLGVSQMSLLRFVPQTRGRANNSRLALTREMFARLQGLMDNVVKDLASSKVAVRLGCPIDFRQCLSGYARYDRKPKECHAGKDLILVRPQGDVHPCAAWKTLPDTDNIRDKSLQDIWDNSRIFNTIREWNQDGYKSILGRCHYCRFLDSCKTGCLAQRLHHIAMTDDCVPEIEYLYRPVADPLCPVGVQSGDWEEDYNE